MVNRSQSLRARLAMYFVIALLVAGSHGGVHAQSGRLTVHADRPGVKISPMLYGLMTEEINHSYDGGIYAELIRNRAFKDNRTQPVNWTLVADGGGAGTIALDNTVPVNDALPTSLKLTVTAATGNQRVGVANSGYWGIPIKPTTRYRCSFFARASDDFKGPLNVDIESNDGGTLHCHA